MLSALKIIAMAVFAAMVYGIVHDEITARICVEYFTIGHPPILNGTQSPTLLGLDWGVIATWWAGAMIGVPLAVVAQAGRSRRAIGAGELVKPIGLTLIGMGACAAIGGAIAFRMAKRGLLDLADPLSWKVPAEQQYRFIGVGGAHLASYLAGFVGGLVLCGYVGVKRMRSSRVRGKSASRLAG